MKRERERQRQMEVGGRLTETDEERETDRQTDRDRQRETDRQTFITQGLRHKCLPGHLCLIQ